jgi:hypothetical protein
LQQGQAVKQTLCGVLPGPGLTHGPNLALCCVPSPPPPAPSPPPSRLPSRVQHQLPALDPHAHTHPGVPGRPIRGVRGPSRAGWSSEAGSGYPRCIDWPRQIASCVSPRQQTAARCSIGARRQVSSCTAAHPPPVLASPLAPLVPTLLLPRSVLPKAEVAGNPFLALAATRRGGHLGFLQGTWPLGVSYADAAVDDWLAAALGLAAEEGAAAFSWQERAAALGWAPPEAGGDVATALAAARCDCLQRHHPGLAAARAAADASAAAAAAVAAAAAAGKGAGAGVGSGGGADKRWRLEEVLRAPVPSDSKGLGLLGVWTSLAGMAGMAGWRGQEEGGGGNDNGERGRRVAVPSVTLEVPSPTLEQRQRSKL